MTAPNIETGIPLRVFDILGAGGFLITDWREDLKDCFTIGKDLEVYDGIDDLLEKTDYYLKHEDILKGGVIKCNMDSQPNLQRGTQPADFPYSFSKEKKN